MSCLKGGKEHPNIQYPSDARYNVFMCDMREIRMRACDAM